MVEKRVTDGVRIGQLLASEIEGRDGRLADLAVSDADPDAEGTTEGQRAYDVVAGDRLVARAFVHEDRLRLEVRVAPEAALERARDLDLRTRPRASDPPRTVVFVESGSAVKRASDLIGELATLGDEE